jgi:hypothetical protein
MKECDLSGPLQEWLRQEHGLCVHGEVSVFDRSRTLDHVAHEGPCWAPTRVWNLEMKVGMTTDLLRQAAGVARGHLTTLEDSGPPPSLPFGVWVVTPLPKRPADLAKARAKVLATRADLKYHPYLQPGWITVDVITGKVEVQEVPYLRPPLKYGGIHIKRLLLVPQNRGRLGGLPGGKGEAVTHWSVCWSAVTGALSQPPRAEDSPLPWSEETLRHFLTAPLEDQPLAVTKLLAPYRSRRALVSRLGKELADKGLLRARPRYGSLNWRPVSP